MFKFIQSHRIKITVIAALSVIGGGAFAMAGQAKAKKAGHGDVAVWTQLREAGATEFLAYETLQAEASVRGARL